MKKIIVDTDLGYDVDDAATLAFVDILHNKRAVELCAVTHCLSEEKAGDAVAWINGYYGIDAPIGLSKDRYDAKALKKFINKISIPKNNDYASAVALLKEILSSSEDKSVTLLCIGQLNNLCHLLQDEIGQKLAREKLQEIVVMGGYFEPYESFYEYGGIRWKGEFNIISDLLSAQSVVEFADLPLSFVDFKQGVDVELDVDKINFSKNHPIDKVYRIAGFCKRPSWDIVAALYACGGFEDCFRLSSQGRIYIDGNGKTTFKTGVGAHKLVYLKNNDSQAMQATIEKFFKENQ